MSESNIDTTSTNLIVNFLPQMMRESELYDMFTAIGPVNSCRVMKDIKTDYSYGFGFVNYVHRKDAEKAIQQLNGLEISNKRLKVSFARPRRDIQESNLYITNIPRHFTSDKLKAIFEPYGSIVQMNMLMNKLTGMPSGVAFVRFSLREEALNAIKNLDRRSLDGSSELLSVRVADDHGKNKSAFYAGLQVGLQTGLQAGFRRGRAWGCGAHSVCTGAMRQDKERFNPIPIDWRQAGPQNGNERGPGFGTGVVRQDEGRVDLTPFGWRQAGPQNGRGRGPRQGVSRVMRQDKRELRFHPMIPLTRPAFSYQGLLGQHLTRQYKIAWANKENGPQDNTCMGLMTSSFLPSGGKGGHQLDHNGNTMVSSNVQGGM